MSDVNVLVVFYSRRGQTERLALAAGLGAIQMRGNIRLRRVADTAARATIEADPAWSEHLERMNLDYVTPRPADALWADVIVLATPDDSPAEATAYVESLATLGTMDGKIAAPISSGGPGGVLKDLYGAAACAGLLVAPAPSLSSDAIAGAQAHGRRVCQIARALKDMRSSVP
jgi:hypothetical protein